MILPVLVMLFLRTSVLEVPEYCSNFDEDDVLEHCFELISAMDEMVALGYRESINLSQIRQYTEMVSHDEQVYLSMRFVERRSQGCCNNVIVM